MNNTPTPMTDERKASFALDTIRQLETELAAAREELADWHNAAQQVKAEYPDEVHCSCVAILRKQLKDVTEQRDRLAEACSPSFDTTETDAAWSAHCIDPDSASGDPWDLAKKLETELTAVTEQRDELMRYNESFRQDTLICADCDAISIKEYKQAIEQRDRLAEALKDALYDLETSDGLMACDNEEGHSLFCLEQRSIPKERQAIQSLNQAAVKGGSDA